MKRKLFTLLAAFVALVAFQANAQTAWYHIDTKSPTNGSDESSFAAPSSSNYRAGDFAVPGMTGAQFWRNIPNEELDGSLRFANLDAGARNVPGAIGPFMGDYTSYFKITDLSGGAYRVFSITPKLTDRELTFTYKGVTVDRFECIRFTSYSEGASVSPINIGGYVCWPSAGGTGGIENRVYVVVNQTTGELRVMDLDQLKENNASANGTAARPYYSVLWIKATAYGGHWASSEDFKNNDFLKFQFGDRNLNAADNHNPTKSYDLFRVSLVDYIYRQGDIAPWNTDAIFSSSTLRGNWGTNTQGLYFGVGGNGMGSIPLFTLRAVDDSCKYLSVKKENKTYSSEQVVEQVYSNLLELRNYGEFFDQSHDLKSKWAWHAGLSNDVDARRALDNAIATAPGGVNPMEYAASVLSQTFAIWIDVDGSMSIYPASSYVFDPTNHHFDKPEKLIAPNHSLIRNSWDGTTDGVPSGHSFKIGRRIDGQYNMEGLFCLTPVKTFAPTYENALFAPLDWGEYNNIPSGRYFFLETKPVTAFDKGRTGQDKHPWDMSVINGEETSYVLSVQSSHLEGDWYKKIVMIPKEQLKPSDDRDYSRNGLDSVIMSAHWTVVKVFDQVSNNFRGYRFVNELGDTLKYAGDSSNDDFQSLVGSIQNNTPLFPITPHIQSWTALSNSSPVGNNWSGVTRFDHNSFPYWVHGAPFVDDGQKDANPRYFTGGFPWLSDFRPGFQLTQDPYINAVYERPSRNHQHDRWDNQTYTRDTWTTVKAKGNTDDYFYLRLNTSPVNSFLWSQAQVNLDTIPNGTGGLTAYDNVGIYEPYWYSNRRADGGVNRKADVRVATVKPVNDNPIGVGVAEYYYWQRDVVARPYASNATVDFGASCNKGIALKLTPVTYGAVPEYTDASNPNYYLQDSLSAYLFENGNHYITEAMELNKHFHAKTSGGVGSDVGVIEMKSTEEINELTDYMELEPVGEDRAQQIELFFAGGGSIISRSGMVSDALYGDPYKWFYIKRKVQANNSNNYVVEYLTFDYTSIPNTADEQFRFKFRSLDTKLNATPVRLYQPLVGDKINRNFIIQFIVPSGYYVFDAQGRPDWGTGRTRSYSNYLGIGGTYLLDPIISGGRGEPDIFAGAVRFAKVSKQTGALVVTGNSKAGATRFKFTQVGPPPCTQEFVTTDYLMDNGMYRLPITAQVHEPANPAKDPATGLINWFIANGATDSNGEELVERETAANATLLKITLADTLHAQTGVGVADGGIGAYRWGIWPDSIKNPDIHTSDLLNDPNYKAFADSLLKLQATSYWGYSGGTHTSHAAAGTDPYSTIKKDVHLFYIQNNEGHYLTIVENTRKPQDLSSVTNPDVDGGKLVFKKELYTYTNQDYKDRKVDKRPLQMFAIYGCTSTNCDLPYGQFIFLPAACYEYDFKTLVPYTPQPKTNSELGVYDLTGYNTVVTSAFRISLHAKGKGGATPYLVVSPGRKTGQQESVPAEEFKFNRHGVYTSEFCHHNFVGNLNKTAVKNFGGNKTYDWYYGADGYYTKNDHTKPITHWSINKLDTKDCKSVGMFTFEQELKNWRGRDITNETLTGQYYIVQLDGSNYESNKVGKFEIFTRTNPRVVDSVEIACIDDKNFDMLCDDPKESELTKCYDNYYRFCDNTIRSTDFGIIEALFNDRCIYEGGILPNTGNAIYDAIAKPMNGKPADSLEIIKSNERPISEHHSIPYYNIVLRKNGVPYYLEVDFGLDGKPDNVFFRTLSAADLDTLANFEKYPNSFPGMKFCFPYRLDQYGDRVWVNNPKYFNKEFHQVYIQTLDTGYVNADMLKASVISIDHDSRTMIATQIDESDILNIDYSDSKKLDATTWFFGDRSGAAYEWVRLQGVLNSGDSKNTEGWLTGVGTTPGTLYVAASGNSTVNYGVMKGAAANAKLTFEFVGDTVIGAYNEKPIWYYRIKNAEGKYLTNAVEYEKETNYAAYYTWSDKAKPYAFFTDKLASKVPVSYAAVKGDANFNQVFGLRHVPKELQPGKTENQCFWVVSEVDYHDRTYGDYYYLAEYHERLVFDKADLKNPETVNGVAMMLQLGKVDNGIYQDIDNVGNGALKAYGLDGAVKVLNATGAIELYTIDGRKINTVVATGEEQTITAPRGVVIVKNGTNVAKVVVK